MALSLRMYLSGLYEEGKAHQNKYSSKWAENIKFAQGQQYETRREKFKTDFILNLIRKIIDRKAALLTDSRPIISVVDRTGQMPTIATAITKRIESIWDERSLQDLWLDLWKQAGHYGTDFVQTIYDPWLDFGSGDIDILRPASPADIVFSPSIISPQNLYQSGYIIHEQIMELGEIRQRFGEIGYLVKPDPTASTYPDPKSSVGKLAGAVFKFISSTPYATSIIPRAIVRKFWFKDYAINENPDPVWMGPPKTGYWVSSKEPLYPAGRLVNMVGLGEGLETVILSDSPNPFWDQLWPYDMLNWYHEIDRAWGTSEVEEIKQLQRIFNKVGGLLVDIALYMANPKWIGDEHALTPAQWDELSNDPTQKLRIQKPGARLERLPGLRMDQSLMGFWKAIMDAIEYKTEMTDAAQGQLPAGTTSGYMLELLQANILVTIRAMARTFETLLNRVGQKMISRIFQYWIPARLLTFESTRNPLYILFQGETGDTEKFQFELEQFKKAYPPENGGMRKAFLDYKFTVKPGSSLATTKIERASFAEKALQNGGITLAEYRAIIAPILGVPAKPEEGEMLVPGGMIPGMQPGGGIQPGAGPSSGQITVPNVIGKR